MHHIVHPLQRSSLLEADALAAVSQQLAVFMQREISGCAQVVQQSRITLE